MCTPVSVELSGPVFSSLLYENSKCNFQQEGFLLGDILHKETRTITDNDQQQINISKIIKVTSIVPCPKYHYFYSGCGKIDENKIREFLGNHFGKVVAWYKYQRVPSLRLTSRDKIIHKQLIDLFNITPELFTCCLLINEISEMRSTHIFSQIFLRRANGDYDKLPFHIPNLSEPNNTYKYGEPPTETFTKILRELKIDWKTTHGLVAINRIQNALQKHIDSITESLSEREKYLYELEQEVKSLETVNKLESMNNRKVKNYEKMDNFDSSQSQNDCDPFKNENLIDTSSQSSGDSPEIQRNPSQGRDRVKVRGRGRGARKN